MPNLRNKERKDYAAINSGRMSKKQYNSSSSSEDDIPGEMDLIGDEELDFVDDEMKEDDFLEEGEIDQESEESEDEMDKLIKKYTKEGNVNKLKQKTNARN